MTNETLQIILIISLFINFILIQYFFATITKKYL